MTDRLDPPTTPAFILVRPQMGENIGAAARGMWNFGLDRMGIVAPRDGWPNAAATALASGAGRVLDAAQISGDLPEALRHVDYVFATTARSRDLTKPIYSPEEAMRESASLIDGGRRVAVLFGPERAGLENEDISRANAIISVPVNPQFPSLNLAQCVLLLAYEWRRATGEVTPRSVEMAGTVWADQGEIEHLASHYEEQLDRMGFFFPVHKSASMRLNMRNFWSRMPMTRADVQMMHGILRQVVRWASREK